MLPIACKSTNTSRLVPSTGKDHSCPVFSTRTLLYAFPRDEVNHAFIETVGCAPVSHTPMLIFPHRSSWVARILQWVTQWHEGYEGSLSSREEVKLMVSKLLALYSTAELGSQPNAKVR